MSKQKLAFGFGVLLFTFLIVALSVSFLPAGWVTKAVIAFAMLYLPFLGYVIGATNDKKN